ncbi:hypothetical protein AB0F91_21580 [Amycolatopsis sp. NPDC023774]|uniref:hypothetical protein n=1 Tax=Amycolatopsis sp. NPDC023774 TaxID=3155015 RepID=UPI0033C0E586
MTGAMQYAKAAAVLAAGVSAILAALTGDQTISTPEWVNVAIVIAVASAASVFAAPNVPGAPVTKLVLIMTGLTAVVNVIDTAGATGWWQLLTVFLWAVFVYAVRNSANPPTTG